jgi:F-type H+-transporting ATPase subunit a
MEVHVELAAEKLFSIGPITVTNSMLMMFVVMGLIIIAFSGIARRAQVVPSRAQGFLELIVEFLLGLVEGTAGRRLGRSIFPLISAIFIFIAFSNYSGLLPGVGTIGYWHEEAAEVSEGHATTEGTTADEEHATGEETTAGEDASHEETANGTEGAAAATSEEETHEESHRVLVPYLRAPNADLNMTLAMALITFGFVQYAGIKAHGVRGRIRHMAQPWWIFPLEVIQEVARIVSLSFRLFGNIFAGEVLLAVMYAMAAAIRVAIIPLLFPVIFLFLEVLFGTIQALVFALLTLIYITLAAAGEHDDHEHEEEHATAPQPATGTAAAHGAGD